MVPVADRGNAYGFFYIGPLVGPVIGPTLGGQYLRKKRCPSAGAQSLLYAKGSCANILDGNLPFTFPQLLVSVKVLFHLAC